MADPGTRAADRAQAEMERRMRRIYRQAQKEIVEKLDAHTKAMNARAKVKQAQLAAGEITQKQFDEWMNGQIFQSKQWKDKVNSVAETLLNANRQSNAIVEGKRRAVFGENATYQAYKLEKDAGLDLSFSVYDSATVTRLIKDEPELLPRRTVNGKKDKAWNRKKIANSVTEGVIQGESIPQIAQRIARETASQNMKAMTRYARTAMTSAQNAGRMEVLHEAQDMGIKVKKKWLATLDDRTRDSHAYLDGQVVDVDEPFVTRSGEKIMYPGDPSADPSEVYNCRCTMVYVYEDYPTPEGAMRRDNISGKLIRDMTYKEWKGALTGAESGGKTGGLKPWKGEVLPNDSENERTVFKSAGIQRIGGEHTYIEDLWMTNPDFEEGTTETTENCQRCVLAYVARRKGFDVEAERIYDVMTDDLALNNGWKRAFGGDPGFTPIFSITERQITGQQIRDNITKVVQNSDNGAIYVVSVDWEGLNSGHVFIAENHNGDAVFFDPQNPANNQDTVWDRITPRATRLFRVDDKPFTSTILKGVKKRK